MRFPRPVSTFQGTKANTVLITSEHAVASFHDTCHQVALFVDVRNALLVDNGLRRSRQVSPYRIKDIFYPRYFIQGNRSARVTFHATFTFAYAKVAAKFLRKYIRRNQDVSYLYDMKFSFIHPGNPLPNNWRHTLLL